MKLTKSACRISKYIIKEERKLGVKEMTITNENGDYIGNVTPRNAYQFIEFRIAGLEILARRHSSSKNYYDIIKEGTVIGRFFKSGTFQSDIELHVDGSTVQFSIFSDAAYKTAKIMSHGVDIGLLSRKKKLFKEEYGLAINSNDHVELILTAILLHVQFQKNIVLSDHNIFL